MALTLHLIVGLPGSGKTHLLEQLALQLTNALILDDPRTPAELEIFIAKVQAESPTHIVIADPCLCEARNRKAALDKLVARLGVTAVNWIFFENNPNQCMKNVHHRNDGRAVYGYIRQLTKVYVIPEGVIPLKIWVAPDPI